MNRWPLRLAAWILLLGLGSRLPCRAQDPVGTIRGMVMDAEFGGPVPDAVLNILETGATTTSTSDGHFRFEAVPAGTYTLTAGKPGYERKILSSVTVTPGALADLAIDLKGEFTEMEEFVVRDLEIENTETEAGLLSLRESSVTLQDSISRDLMSKAGAGDAASALKLVVGASVVDGKYASVRGLSDRYVGVAMNSIRVPSSDPKKRAVHMDIFPAGTIESISVSKTFTPDLPGDYTGGGVNIRTVGIPQEPFVKFAFSREHYRNISDKDGFVTYEGGGINQWGRDMGERSLNPDAATMEETLPRGGVTSDHEVPASRANPHDDSHRAIDRITDSFSPAMGVQRGHKVPPSHGYSLSAGERIDMEDGWALGAIGAFTYGRRYQSRLVEETVHTEGSYDTTIDDEFRRREEGQAEVKSSLLTSVGLAKPDEHDVRLVYMRNRTATDTASYREDVLDDTFTPIDKDALEVNEFFQQQQAIHYSERTIDSLQFTGQHEWPSFVTDRSGLGLDWFGAHNVARQYEPDVRFFKNIVIKRSDDPPLFQSQPREDGASGAASDNSTRNWRDTQDDNSIFGGVFRIPFTWSVPDWNTSFLGLGAEEAAWEEKEGHFQVGALWDYTHRRYNQDSFYYGFADQNAPLLSPPGSPAYQAFENDRSKESYTNNSPNALWTDVFTAPENTGSSAYQNSMLWQVLPQPGDVDYDGRQELPAGHWMMDWPVSKQLTAVFGARVEVTDMTIQPSSDLEAILADDAYEVVRYNVISNADGTVTYLPFIDGVPREEAEAELKESAWLRSIGFVYALTPGMNLRATWSQTIARPTFLELAPIVTYDYIENEAFVGNNTLAISEVVNYDLRWEWFPRPGDVLSVSGFRKVIDNPIDRIRFVYLGQEYVQSVNFPRGTVRGMEFEARRKLDFLPTPFHLLSIGANYTLIDATVEVPDQLQQGLKAYGLDADERDMEGQPDYLRNVSLTYDVEKWGSSVGLYFTEQGDILKTGASPGDRGGVPDVYSLHRATANLNFTQKIGSRWKIDFRMKNLTHPAVREVYRPPDGEDIPRREYKEYGSYQLAVGASW